MLITSVHVKNHKHGLPHEKQVQKAYRSLPKEFTISQPARRQNVRGGIFKDIISKVKKTAFLMIVEQNVYKFREKGSCVAHSGGNGRKKVNDRLENKIVQEAKETKGSGIRKISKKTGASFKCVANILHRHGLRAYHKYRTQI